MQHKTIIATCAAMAAFSGMATADIQLPLDVLNANNGGKTFSAQLGAGYATQYIRHGNTSAAVWLSRIPQVIMSFPWKPSAPIN